MQETMLDYGDFLFGIGLVDEQEREVFKKYATLQLKYIRTKEYEKAFQVRLQRKIYCTAVLVLFLLQFLSKKVYFALYRCLTTF